MSMIDIINSKRIGNSLSKDELKEAFLNYYQGNIPDYQMSSLLMAICINGMTDSEILDLTDIFINSGEVLDLSRIQGVTIDKHSTGGVGDKTTLVLASIVASCGVKVPKMSGRGLGHTGGTIDKLESIPGFKVDLTEEEFINQLNQVGACVISQTKNLAPLDKKVYALRDVSGTVESIPLIAVSVMSKKIASGADNILIDIKVGNGALLKTKEDAIEISRIMKMIGKNYNKKVETMITDMSIPLGTSIGNSLEILEVIKILKNEENNYLTELCKELSSKMLEMTLGISSTDAMARVNDSLISGRAYQKLLEIIASQGGNLEGISVSQNTQNIYATQNGIINKIDAYQFGRLSVMLGAGRKTKEDIIDYGVGIVLNKEVGNYVQAGDLLCTLYLKENTLPIEFDINQFYTFIDNKKDETIELL